MDLPNITVEFYKKCIEKFLEEDKHDENWITMLQQRKQWADGLLLINPVNIEGQMGYVLCYETRFHLVLLNETILQMMMIVPDRAAEFAAHWLMQKHCWMAEFQEMPNLLSAYNSIAAGIATPASDPHVEFFRQRWQVKMARFLSVGSNGSGSDITVPENVHYNNRRSFVILYGAGTMNSTGTMNSADITSENFPIQFETHLISLIELLNPECSNPKVVEVLCKQVTNEVSVISPETQTSGWKLDIFLCNRVRELFLIRAPIVNSVVNQHIHNLLNMKNEEAGRDLAARFTMAIKSIVPGIQINALPAALEQQYQDFIRGSDIK